MIYVISNVPYDEENRLSPEPNDLLVFLNKAASYEYYADHENKLIIRRMTHPQYGADIPEAKTLFIFNDENPSLAMPKDTYKRIFDAYKQAAPESASPTTGYLAVQWLKDMYPGEPITLVNFGFEVANSTYRSVLHDWKLEDNVLSNLPHIYTAEKRQPPKMEIVYCADKLNMPYIEMSAATVLKNNPNAHITIVSQKKQDTKYDNVTFKLSSYRLLPSGNLGGISSPTGYLKLFLPNILDGMDKIIYLSAYTICKAPLDNLWNAHIPFIGLAHSHDAGKKQEEEIGLKRYGLTAVMHMNLANLRDMDFTKLALFALNNFKFPKTSWYKDETVINCCFHNFLTYISTKWAFCVNREYKAYMRKDQEHVPDELTFNGASILYYIGGQHDEQKAFFDKGTY